VDISCATTYQNVILLYRNFKDTNNLFSITDYADLLILFCEICGRVSISNLRSYVLYNNHAALDGRLLIFRLGLELVVSPKKVTPKIRVAHPVFGVFPVTMATLAEAPILSAPA